MKVQVIVSKDDRSWDSIRASEGMALYQVGIYMEKDDDLEIFVVGRGIADRISTNKSIDSVKEWLDSRGYTVTTKHLNQGE
jgi:hypothetical protein